MRSARGRAEATRLRAEHVAQAQQTARIARRAALATAAEVLGPPLSPADATNREVILSRLAGALATSRTIAQECAAAGAAGGAIRSATQLADLRTELLRLNAAVGTLARITTGELRLLTARLEGTD